MTSMQILNFLIVLFLILTILVRHYFFNILERIIANEMVSKNEAYTVLFYFCTILILLLAGMVLSIYQLIVFFNDPVKVLILKHSPQVYIMLGKISFFILLVLLNSVLVIKPLAEKISIITSRK